MWTKIPECRKNPYCPLMEKREEHLVYLIFDYHGGGDKLPMECGRFMTVGMAVQILSCEMKTAKALGKKKLLVIIKGGDPFRRLEDLKSLCSQVWKEAEKTKIQVCIEVKTSSEHISPEAFQWYQKNADKVSLWFRCSGFDKGIAEILKKTGCGLLYEMDVTKTGEVISNLFEWHSREIPIQLEMKTPIEDWSRETLENYEKICDGLRAYLPELIAFPWSGETLRLLKGKVGSSGNIRRLLL